MNIADLISTLQVAIGPVVLVSGVGLLILSLTNRLGRVVDRGRILSSEIRELTDPDDHRRSTIAKQLEILSQRAHKLQHSIFLAVLSLLFSAILVILLFFTATLKIDTVWPILLLFGGALGSLIASLIIFLRELRQSLIAFDLEIKS